MAKKRANGEGNIRKRKDGRWEGRYTVGYDPVTGKPITKNVLARTQTECKEKLKAELNKAEVLDYSKADKTGFQFLQRVLHFSEVTIKGPGEHTPGPENRSNVAYRRIPTLALYSSNKFLFLCQSIRL